MPVGIVITSQNNPKWIHTQNKVKQLKLKKQTTTQRMYGVLEKEETQRRWNEIVAWS